MIRRKSELARQEHQSRELEGAGQGQHRSPATGTVPLSR